jgi:ectoine hydroxylase
LWVVDPGAVRALAKNGGIVSATGRAGTGLIFGDVMLHASPSNISPFDRRIFSLIVNPISNALTRHQRPDHNHHRDLNPVIPIDDDCLLN